MSTPAASQEAIVHRAADQIDIGIEQYAKPCKTRSEGRQMMRKVIQSAIEEDRRHFVCGTCGASVNHPESRAAQPQRSEQPFASQRESELTSSAAMKQGKLNK
jgi:hypothetical protein